MTRTDKHDRQACEGCMYQSISNGWCNYGDITGRSRLVVGGPLHPDGGCDLYSKGQLERRRPVDFYLPPERDKTLIPKLARTHRETRIEYIYDQIEALYKQGLCDDHIAKECGCNPKTVYNWRQRRGLESNWVKARKAKARSKAK